MSRGLGRGVLLVVALLIGAAARAAPAESFTGTVTHVTDGDTVWVRPEASSARSKPIKLRLVGIDAPERCQAHGAEAGAALAAAVLHRRVEIRRRATDDHGRALGTLWLDGEDVGARMVRQGHAWSARFRRDAGPYAREEQQARAAGLGLFAHAAPESPRDFRRRHGPCDARP
ncbi:MAG TPA: thermonuclease family protein [Methylibium sp.]|nr:thermonuclease family protein [Methylibium sp.]